MSDCDWLASLLSDGKPHSLNEILRRSFAERGCGLTVHSRCSDLRKRGYQIRCDHVPGAARGEAYVYTMTSLPPPAVSADWATGIAGDESEAVLARPDAVQPSEGMNDAPYSGTSEPEEQTSLALWDAA